MRPFHLPGSYLVLELTNVCSLACLHCTVSEEGHPHHDKNGYMSVSLIREIFADLARHGGRFDTLILFWLGEPLLHPAFVEIYQEAIRAAVDFRLFGKVEVHSNATHLRAELAPALLNRARVPQVWHFSLDANSSAVYQRVKGLNRFDKVIENIDTFLDVKAARQAPWPRTVFQFIVSDRNAGEALAFRDRWLQRCKSLKLPVRVAAQQVPDGDDAVVFYRQLDCPTAEEQQLQNRVFGQVTQQLGLATPRLEAEVRADNRGICGCFWKSPVVSWQGELSTCTRDNRLENRLGSVVEHGFSKLWWGPEQAARRAAVARADYSLLPPCKSCFIPKSSNYSDVTAAEIGALQ